MILKKTGVLFLLLFLCIGGVSAFDFFDTSFEFESMSIPANLTCVQAKNAGLIFGQIIGNSAWITNNANQSYLVGFASYKMFDNVLGNQVLFSSNTTIHPGQTINLTIELPPCRYQSDLFCGEVITNYTGTSYGPRLIKGFIGNTNKPYCLRDICGNGIINVNETCEFPNSTNNPFCTQTNLTCLGNMTGTRDNKGNCNAFCGCSQDEFIYSCVKGSCGAECSVNSDCGQKECDDRCIGNNYYDFEAEENECLGDCGCEDNQCEIAEISYNDRRCCVDEDNDCVCDNVDDCLNSREGEVVDENGCDAFQFCGQVTCGCENLDFIPKFDDECRIINSGAEENPADCITVLLNKEGKQYPRCFPLTCTD